MRRERGPILPHLLPNNQLANLPTLLSLRQTKEKLRPGRDIDRESKIGNRLDPHNLFSVCPFRAIRSRSLDGVDWSIAGRPDQCASA